MPGMAGTMAEFKAGKLSAGPKKGKKVKSKKQAMAIGMSQERKMSGSKAHRTELAKRY